MWLKAALSKVFAVLVNRQLNNIRHNAVTLQEKTFQKLISQAKNTEFGKANNFDKISSYDDFKTLVPVCDYEELRPYIERVVNGEENILWPGKPLYLTKTSGTTSGVKYIPISKESMPAHITSARNALLSYVHETGNADFLNGKLIFLQGSPILSKKSGIETGRLSGIVAHHVPGYLQKNRMPSYEINCIEDWEQKIDAIVDETINEDMRLISGIPPWCQMYFDRLSAKSGGKKISLPSKKSAWPVS